MNTRKISLFLTVGIILFVPTFFYFVFSYLIWVVLAIMAGVLVWFAAMTFMELWDLVDDLYIGILEVYTREPKSRHSATYK